MIAPLLPCPFCGSTDVNPVGITRCDDEGECDAAGCNRCGASGPYLDYDDKSADAAATELWNRRAGRETS